MDHLRSIDEAADVSLRMHFLSRRAALSSSRTEGNRITLLVTSERPLPVRQRVQLQVSFGDTEHSFELHGSVVSQALTRRPDGLGLTIGFEGEDKRRAWEMLAFCAGRERSMGTAANPRMSVRVACRIRTASQKGAGQVVDLSRGGAFIAAGPLRGLRPGDNIRVQLGPGLLGLGGLWLDARVVWCGSKRGRTGYGVRFTGDASAALKRFASVS